MKANITIECETGGEMVSHLHCLLMQMKKEIRKAKKTGNIKKPIILEDSNCYGDHIARIRDFDGDELLHEINIFGKI